MDWLNLQRWMLHGKHNCFVSHLFFHLHLFSCTQSALKQKTRANHPFLHLRPVLMASELKIKLSASGIILNCIKLSAGGSIINALCVHHYMCVYHYDVCRHMIA